MIYDGKIIFEMIIEMAPVTVNYGFMTRITCNQSKIRWLLVLIIMIIAISMVYETIQDLGKNMY
jgi:hypothetical protein